MFIWEQLQNNNNKKFCLYFSKSHSNLNALGTAPTQPGRASTFSLSKETVLTGIRQTVPPWAWTKHVVCMKVCCDWCKHSVLSYIVWLRLARRPPPLAGAERQAHQKSFFMLYCLAYLLSSSLVEEAGLETWRIGMAPATETEATSTKAITVGELAARVMVVRLPWSDSCSNGSHKSLLKEFQRA